MRNEKKSENDQQYKPLTYQIVYRFDICTGCKSQVIKSVPILLIRSTYAPQIHCNDTFLSSTFTWNWARLLLPNPFLLNNCEHIEQMAIISHTTLLNVFVLLKIWIEYCGTLSSERSGWQINRCCFRKWLGANNATSNFLNQWWPKCLPPYGVTRP